MDVEYIIVHIHMYVHIDVMYVHLYTVYKSLLSISSHRIQDSANPRNPSRCEHLWQILQRLSVLGPKTNREIQFVE